MAVNLRLTPQLAEALHDRSAASGVSQQEIMRRALERYLAEPADAAAAYRARVVPAVGGFLEASERMVLPTGVRSTDLLDRDDRL